MALSRPADSRIIARNVEPRASWRDLCGDRAAIHGNQYALSIVGGPADESGVARCGRLFLDDARFLSLVHVWRSSRRVYERDDNAVLPSHQPTLVYRPSRSTRTADSDVSRSGAAGNRVGIVARVGAEPHWFAEHRRRSAGNTRYGLRR